MQKKILLTNYSLRNYTGSEIDTVEIANYLFDKGYDVTIFTIYKGLPLISETNSEIKVIDINEINKLEKQYDLCWSHHFPLLDYLIFDLNISFNHVVYFSLSYFSAYENIPTYYKYLNKVFVNSKEALNEFVLQGYDKKDLNIFSNNAFKSYFKNHKKIHSKHLKKVAIVSNHLVSELYELRDIFKQNDIIVDIYGKDNTYVKVDDALLLNYDLIITIGKTVNYALALKIPVYVYDHLGGDGYLMTEELIKGSYEYNFSGRYLHKRFNNGKELYNDIIENYSQALNRLNYNYKFAINNFMFENKVDEILNQLDDDSKIDLENLKKNNKNYRKTSGLLINAIIQQKEFWNEDIFKIQDYQIYYYKNNEYTETNSKIFYYAIKDNIHTADIIIPKNTQKIRFDYSSKPNTVIKWIKINNKEFIPKKLNNAFWYDKKIVSFSNDPSIEIEYTNPKIKIEICFENLSNLNLINH